MNDTPPFAGTPPPFPINVRRIRVRRFKAGSLLKLVFAGVASTAVPLFIFFGVLAFFGAKTVTVSGEHVTGIKGLGAALLMAPFFAVFCSAFLWVGCYVGLRIWGRFSPLELEYVPAEEPDSSPPMK